MKLLNATLLAIFKKVRCQRGTRNPLVIAKFFDAETDRVRYATEFYESDDCFFGLVIGDYSERGYFYLAELESIFWTGTNKKSVERDNTFMPQRFLNVDFGVSNNNIFYFPETVTEE